MSSNGPLLTKCLKNPYLLEMLTDAEWTLLIRQASASGLLLQVFGDVRRIGIYNKLPHSVLWRVHAAENLSNSHKIAIEWEIECIKEALAEEGMPVVLLKGAAYLVAGLGFSANRLYSDIDILVPEKDVMSAVSALRRHGWLFEDKDEYDQRYYWRWMHEIPPMRNAYRSTHIDVHYNIFPRVGKYQPSANLLLENAVNSVRDQGCKVLSPVDMAIHCATHQFGDGEFDRSLRNLFDFKKLLDTYSGSDGFWNSLLERAQELDLVTPTHLALMVVQRLLGVTVPESVVSQFQQHQSGKIRFRVVAWLYCTAITPEHPSCVNWAVRSCRSVLYIRGHYLKMPARLLLPHLIRKSWLTWSKERKTKDRLEVHG